MPFFRDYSAKKALKPLFLAYSLESLAPLTIPRNLAEPLEVFGFQFLIACAACFSAVFFAQSLAPYDFNFLIAYAAWLSTIFFSQSLSPLAFPPFSLRNRLRRLAFREIGGTPCAVWLQFLIACGACFCRSYSA